MTQYMFMLFDDESWYDRVDEQGWRDSMKLHIEFAAAVEAAGATIAGGDALLRTNTATTVRNRPGAEPLATDGPCLEPKEARPGPAAAGGPGGGCAAGRRGASHLLADRARRDRPAHPRPGSGRGLHPGRV